MLRISRILAAIGTLAVLFGVGCSGPQPPAARQARPAGPPDRTIEVTLIQVNDVYEITAVQGGEWGGIARLATLRKRLLADNPNTYTLIAGDFFSPSALGTAKVDGERLAGKQMVAALNSAGLDYATFGNHEFDVSKDAFYQRLGESQFTYVSSNVFDEHGRPFPGVVAREVLKVPGQPGDTLRIGLVAVTLDVNPQPYVSYTDPIRAVKEQVAALTGRTDALVALTHLALGDDEKLAAAVPALDLIMGGHEHENYRVLRGPDLTPITKADANARTAFVHTLRFDPATGALDVDSRLVFITRDLPDDPATAEVVERWVEVAFEGFRQAGLEPGAPVVALPVALDGRESSVRKDTTALTKLLADAFLHAAPDAELSVYNSGSIRIDDVLPPGTLIQYDVIRILPFGGDIFTVDMKGSLLDSTLTASVANRGTGGFLHHANVDQRGGTWRVGGRPLDPNRTYRVAISDFLVQGLEANLEFLTFANPGLTRVATHGDVRLAVIDEMKRRYEP